MTTPLVLAMNLFSGVEEREGADDHPMILAALQLAAPWPEHDEVPWCSAVPFLAFTALGLPTPARLGLMARSWLGVGEAIRPEDARPGFDLAIFSRGENAPGPEVLNAPGHVAFFLGLQGEKVVVWGGNQNDGANLAYYPRSRLLGIRRP